MSNVIPMVSASPPPMDEGGGFNDWGDDDDDDFGDFASANDSNFSAITSTDEQQWSTSLPSTPVKHSKDCDSKDTLHSNGNIPETTSPVRKSEKIRNSDGNWFSDSNDNWCSNERKTETVKEQKELVDNGKCFPSDYDEKCVPSDLSSHVDAQNSKLTSNLSQTENKIFVSETCIKEPKQCERESENDFCADFSPSECSEESMSVSVSVDSKEQSPMKETITDLSSEGVDCTENKGKLCNNESEEKNVDASIENEHLPSSIKGDNLCSDTEIQYEYSDAEGNNVEKNTKRVETIDSEVRLGGSVCSSQGEGLEDFGEFEETGVSHINSPTSSQFIEDNGISNESKEDFDSETGRKFSGTREKDDEGSLCESGDVGKQSYDYSQVGVQHNVENSCEQLEIMKSSSDIQVTEKNEVVNIENNISKIDSMGTLGTCTDHVESSDSSNTIDQDQDSSDRLETGNDSSNDIPDLELRVSISEDMEAEDNNDFDDFTNFNSKTYEEESEKSDSTDQEEKMGQNGKDDDGEDDDFGDFGEAAATAGEASEWAAFSSGSGKAGAGSKIAESEEKDSDWAAFGGSDEVGVSKPENDGDEDEFGDFGDFSEGADQGNSWAAFSSPKTEELESYLIQNKENLIAACFSDRVISIEPEDILNLEEIIESEHSRQESSKKPLWIDLIQQDSERLSHLWQNSLGSNKLFSSLHIDTRNILLGHKKPSVPVYAAGLGLLEPTKGPVQADPQKGAKLVDTTKQEETVSQDMPPVQFDWTGSGLTNPLEANEALGLDFLEVQDADSSKSDKLQDFGLDIGQLPKEHKPALQPLESILANIKPTMVMNVTENLSAEAKKIITSLPNLGFMQSKVLMFPIHSMSDSQ